MKKIVSSVLIFATCLMIGCKPDKCNQSSLDGPLPDDCYDCQWYAPASATISWTDYNTVMEARSRFTCHKETLKENEGKTLKIKGWLYWGCNSEWTPDYMCDFYVADGSNWLYLTDKRDHTGGNQLFSILLNKGQFDLFMEHKEEFLEKRWYVTGVLKDQNMGVGGCCSHEPFLQVIEFDTINTI